MLVGSVKTAIGHTEGCAGLAGLIKAANALNRAVIPPNMLFEKLNPKLLPLTSNLKVVTEERPWPSLLRGQSRRASVNSFGFGGTNAVSRHFPSSLVSKANVSVKISTLF